MRKLGFPLGILVLVSIGGVMWATSSISHPETDVFADTTASHIAILIAAADTEVDSGSPDMNWGDWQYIHVGSSSYFGNMRGLVGGFNVSEIPRNAIITKATLALWYYLSSYPPLDMTITAHRITRSWGEMTATWNNTGSAFGEAYGSDTLGGYEDDDRWTNIDVTGLVQGWVVETIRNYGIGLVGAEGPPENYKYLNSREKGTGWEPSTARRKSVGSYQGRFGAQNQPWKPPKDFRLSVLG